MTSDQQDTTPPPKKYTTVNGVMKLNPEYTKWVGLRNSVSKPVTTVHNPEIALPIVSNMDDYEQIAAVQAMVVQTPREDVDIPVAIPLTDLTTKAMEKMQEPEICVVAGLQPDNALDELFNIFAKYEVPMGMINKLLDLEQYDSLEFIIDDSGSMRHKSDTINPLTKQYQTRWEEAKERLKEMLEIISYLPVKQVGIEFLNRPNRINLIHQGKDPPSFLTDAYVQIDSVFASEPSGTTPALEKLTQSLNRGSVELKISRYFFGDGLPNGGIASQEQIVHLLKHRSNPAGNPITFISCTNDDDQVEWMKEAEEVVPYCSESDDFGDESREVLMDQGKALPYSKGFHLICQLVAAMNPDDLDAMDESVPFTKLTLDNLLGIQSTEETFKHYFNHFQLAQKSRRVQEPADQAKRNVQWNYADFVSTPIAKDIPRVQQFKQELARINAREQQQTKNYETGGYQQQRYNPQPGVDQECCVIL